MKWNFVILLFFISNNNDFSLNFSCNSQIRIPYTWTFCKLGTNMFQTDEDQVIWKKRYRKWAVFILFSVCVFLCLLCVYNYMTIKSTHFFFREWESTVVKCLFLLGMKVLSTDEHKINIKHIIINIIIIAIISQFHLFFCRDVFHTWASGNN